MTIYIFSYCSKVQSLFAYTRTFIANIVICFLKGSLLMQIVHDIILIQTLITFIEQQIHAIMVVNFLCFPIRCVLGIKLCPCAPYETQKWIVNFRE